MIQIGCEEAARAPGGSWQDLTWQLTDVPLPLWPPTEASRCFPEQRPLVGHFPESGFCYSADSSSVGQDWDPRFGTSDKRVGETGAAGPCKRY